MLTSYRAVLWALPCHKNLGAILRLAFYPAHIARPTVPTGRFEVSRIQLQSFADVAAACGVEQEACDLRVGLGVAQIQLRLTCEISF